MTNSIDTLQTLDQEKVLPPVNFTIQLMECVESVGVSHVKRPDFGNQRIGDHLRSSSVTKLRAVRRVGASPRCN